jgi:hypothetical protein
LLDCQRLFLDSLDHLDQALKARCTRPLQMRDGILYCNIEVVKVVNAKREPYATGHYPDTEAGAI